MCCWMSLFIYVPWNAVLRVVGVWTSGNPGTGEGGMYPFMCIMMALVEIAM